MTRPATFDDKLDIPHPYIPPPAKRAILEELRDVFGMAFTPPLVQFDDAILDAIHLQAMEVLQLLNGTDPDAVVASGKKLRVLCTPGYRTKRTTDAFSAMWLLTKILGLSDDVAPRKWTTLTGATIVFDRDSVLCMRENDASPWCSFPGGGDLNSATVAAIDRMPYTPTPKSTSRLSSIR